MTHIKCLVRTLLSVSSRAHQKKPPPDPVAIDGVGQGVVPAQRRSIEARDRLHSAAMEEADRVGVQESRVEKIVAAAGTGWDTFFCYFSEPQRFEPERLFVTRTFMALDAVA